MKGKTVFRNKLKNIFSGSKNSFNLILVKPVSTHKIKQNKFFNFKELKNKNEF